MIISPEMIYPFTGKDDSMSDISVIGLGNMGSALAQTLLNAGYEVTVWNRTKSKATPLVEQGATLADGLAAAVIDSPMFIVSLLNYEVTDRLIFDTKVNNALPGKIMIQLSYGTPQDARNTERLAHRYGAEILSGEIEVFPEQIGGPEATILVAGKESLYDKCKPILKTLAGKTTYLGEQIGAPLAYGTALGSLIYCSLFGALHAARICEVEGLDINQFARGLQTNDLENLGDALVDLLDRINDNRFDQSQATVKVYADGTEQLLQHAHDSDINPIIAQFVDEIMKKAIAAGLGDEDMAAIIKVLRDGN